MYKIHREFDTAWYVTTNRYTQAGIAKDVLDVRCGLSALIMNSNNLSREQILVLLKQHARTLESVYSQMVEPLRDIELAEYRKTN